MNYAIVSAVHGRPHIAEAWAKHLAQHFGGHVVVSGDDPEIRERMFQHLGAALTWVPYCNEPLGAKWNRAAERGRLYADHMLVLGSDDFPSPALFQAWDEAAWDNRRFTCLTSLYFHDLRTRETSILESQGMFGTGRMYAASAFRYLFNSRGFAWEPALGRGLDMSLWKAMGRPLPDCAIDRTDDVWCIAVKSETQVWSYERLKETLNMPIVETLPDSAREFLTWLHEQKGVSSKRRINVIHN